MERNAMPARRRLGLAALIVAAAAATPAALYAQIGQWPTRPVKLVVPFRPEAAPTRSAGCWRSNWPRIWARPSSSRTRAAPTAILARTRWPRPSRTATRCCCRAWARTPSTTRFTPACLTATATSRMFSLLATGPNVLVAAPDFPARPSRTSSAGAREPGQVHPRQLGQRLVRPPGHGNAQAAGQDRSGARAQGRRGGHHGPAGRSRDGAVPQPGHPVAAGAGRQLRALAVASVAQSGVSRHADGGGVRLSRLRGRILVLVGAGQDAARRDPAPEQATAKAMASAEMRQKLESVGFVVVGSDPQAYSGFVTSRGARPPRRPAPAWID